MAIETFEGDQFRETLQNNGEISVMINHVVYSCIWWVS